MFLPKNISFLPGAADEFLRLREENPSAYRQILAALIALGKDGPPEDTHFVPVREPPFPHTLAYRFEVAGYTIVFESDRRFILQTASGIQVVRSVRVGYPRPAYTIWAILPPEI